MVEVGCASERVSNKGLVCRLQRATFGVAGLKLLGDSPVGGSLSVEAHLSLPVSAYPSLLNLRQMTKGESQAALLKLPALTLGHLYPERPLFSHHAPSTWSREDRERITL